MFFSAAAITAALMPLLVNAGPTIISRDTCNSGNINCCNSVQTASPELADSLSGLLGIVVAAGVPIGLNCDPISVIGLGSNQCTQQTVCCENNAFGSDLVGINCTPINIGL